MLTLLIGIGLLCLAGLIPTKPRRASRLSEEERQAWVERDRLAWMEKERQAKALPLHLPGGRFDRSDPD
jgi:Tfp pilus assembly protein PilV